MLIHHLRKTTSGAGGNMMSCCSSSKKAKPHRRLIGNGVRPAVYDSDLAGIRPTRILQNIKIKRTATPKKYITFE